MEGEYFTYTYPTTGDIITFCRTADGKYSDELNKPPYFGRLWVEVTNYIARPYKEPHAPN